MHFRRYTLPDRYSPTTRRQSRHGYGLPRGLVAHGLRAVFVRRPIRVVSRTLAVICAFCPSMPDLAIALSLKMLTDGHLRQSRRVFSVYADRHRDIAARKALHGRVHQFQRLSRSAEAQKTQKKTGRRTAGKKMCRPSRHQRWSVNANRILDCIGALEAPLLRWIAQADHALIAAPLSIALLPPVMACSSETEAIFERGGVQPFTTSLGPACRSGGKTFATLA